MKTVIPTISRAFMCKLLLATLAGLAGQMVEALPLPPGGASAGTTASSTTLKASGTTGYPGSLIILTASVTTGATGNVAFYSGTTPLGVAPIDPTSGAATLNAHFTTTGDYSLTAAYSGDGQYAPSTSSSVGESIVTGSYALNLGKYSCTAGSMTVTTDSSHAVSYCLYSDVVYAANPVNSSYESMNIYLPTSVDGVAVESKPILFENNVAGYLSAEAPSSPQTNGQYALGKGYVVVEVGARGRDNGSSGDYYGVAPAGIVDLKAAIRFLRYSHSLGTFSGDVDHIISSGGSAGGALSTLLGASGGSHLYDSYLAAIGAADATDIIFAVGAWSPITNLDHADGAYEEEYSALKYSGSLVNTTISDDLKTIFERYQDALGLLDQRSGTGPLTHSNIAQYILSQYLEPSLATFVKAGGSVPSYATCSLSGSTESCSFTFANYLTNSIGTRGKSVPAFDSFFDLSSSSAYKGTVVNTSCAAETLEFGDPTGASDSACSSSSSSSSSTGTTSGSSSTASSGPSGAPSGGGPSSSGGSPRHFTNFSSETVDGTAISDSMQTIVNMMNPMYFIMGSLAGPGGPFRHASRSACGLAKYWYIRDGTIATDTSAYVIVDLATAVENVRGVSHVNAAEDWDKGHNVNADPAGFSTWVTAIVAARGGTPFGPGSDHCDAGSARP